MPGRDGASASVTRRNRGSAANWKSVPGTAVSGCNKVGVCLEALLDHLVSSEQEMWWNSQSEHLRGLQVDHEIVLCRLLIGQIAGLFPT